MTNWLVLYAWLFDSGKILFLKNFPHFKFTTVFCKSLAQDSLSFIKRLLQRGFFFSSGHIFGYCKSSYLLTTPSSLIFIAEFDWIFCNLMKNVKKVRWDSFDFAIPIGFQFQFLRVPFN